MADKNKKEDQASSKKANDFLPQFTTKVRGTTMTDTSTEAELYKKLAPHDPPSHQA